MLPTTITQHDEGVTVCIRCEIKRHSEALAWMRDELRDVPDQHVITFARLLEQTVTFVVRGPAVSATREDAIEILAAYFWPARMLTHGLRDVIAKALGGVAEDMERHGYAA